MNVIRHQAIAGYTQPMQSALLSEDIQIRAAVVGHEKHVLAIVSTLRDVVLQLRYYDSRNPWHGYSLTTSNSAVKKNISRGCRGSELAGD